VLLEFSFWILIMCIFICMLFCLIFLLWLGFAYFGWLFNDFVCVFGWFWSVGLIVSACDVFSLVPTVLWTNLRLWYKLWSTDTYTNILRPIIIRKMT
jgi:hypothetical protein